MNHDPTHNLKMDTLGYAASDEVLDASLYAGVAAGVVWGKSAPEDIQAGIDGAAKVGLGYLVDHLAGVARGHGWDVVVPEIRIPFAPFAVTVGDLQVQIDALVDTLENIQKDAQAATGTGKGTGRKST